MWYIISVKISKFNIQSLIHPVYIWKVSCIDVSLYCEMSLLMRYKGMLTAMTNVGLEMGARLQAEILDSKAHS